MIEIRPYDTSDAEEVWSILEPIIVAAETYTLPPDMTREEALAYWCAHGNITQVALIGEKVVGTYYLRRNQLGGGSHVANCGYMVDGQASGRGIARSMCLHSIEMAKQQGFRAMQFNFVVSSNARAVGLWRSLGFAIVGTIPEAFAHPERGFVDAFVMHRRLAERTISNGHQPSSLDQLIAVT